MSFIHNLRLWTHWMILNQFHYSGNEEWLLATSFGGYPQPTPHSRKEHGCISLQPFPESQERSFYSFYWSLCSREVPGSGNTLFFSKSPFPGHSSNVWGEKTLRMLKTHSLPSSIWPLIYKENTPREYCCSFPPPAGFPLFLRQPHYFSLALSIASKTGTFAFLVLAERDPVSISLN